MADSLSHSCPTCGGTGQVSKSDCGYDQWNEPCPDCIDGYPKAAVERAAAVFSELTDINAPSVAREATFRIIRAFNNEGSE